MKNKEELLTLEFINECFEYREDGNLIWKRRPLHHFTSNTNKNRFNTARAGSVAGYFNLRTDSKQEDFGYQRVGITVDGEVRHYKVHRIIWFMHKGYFPALVDHKDNDTRNNRIENLREGTHKKNCYNLKTPINNTSGYKGVSKTNDPKRRRIPYRASIEYNGYIFGLGSYSCKHEAAHAYNLAAKLLFGEFCKLNETPFNPEDFKWKGKFFSKDYHTLKDGTFDWTSKKQRKSNKKVKQV